MTVLPPAYDSDGTGLSSGSARYGENLTADGLGSQQFGNRVWKDLKGIQVADISGPSRPTKATFIGSDIDAFAYSIGDSMDWYFHMPHDYAIGTDIYLHPHWGHNGTALTNTTPFVLDFNITCGKRNTTAPFDSFITPIAVQISSADRKSVV